MKTIKLPIKIDKNLINNYQREYSFTVRIAYNRFLEGFSEKQIRSYLKNKIKYKYLDSWFIQSAIKEGNQIFKNKKKIIFGGRKLFFQWQKTKDKKYLNKWKEKRLLPIISVGEKLKDGNRKFKFNIIENNQIIFKPKREIEINLQLPKLRKNLTKELYKLQQSVENKKLPVSVGLSFNYITLTFDERLLYENTNCNPIKNRIASIDLNPHYVGFVVKDYNKNKILVKETISIKQINDLDNKLKVASNNKKRRYIKNKRKYEILEISKYLVNRAKYFRCEAFIAEKLTITSKNHEKSKKYNRLINNQWNRAVLYNNLEKRLNIEGIKLIKVYPQYSSTIGCITYPDEVDSIASAIEIWRRGYKLLNYDKTKKENVIFPKFDSKILSCRWKDKMKSLIEESKDWKELHKKIKKSGLRYRFLLKDIQNSLKVFSLKSNKSLILIYNDL